MDFTTSWRSDSSELLQVPAAGATKSRSDERSAKAQRRNLQPPSSARVQVAFACSIARRADPKNQKFRLSFFLSFIPPTSLFTCKYSEKDLEQALQQIHNNFAVESCVGIIKA